MVGIVSSGGIHVEIDKRHETIFTRPKLPENIYDQSQNSMIDITFKCTFISVHMHVFFHSSV